MLLSALHQQALGTLEVPVLSTAYVGPVPHFVRNETALRQAGTQPLHLLMGRVLNQLLHYQATHSARPRSAAGVGLRREASEPELQKGWERVAFVEGVDGLSVKGMAEK